MAFNNSSDDMTITVKADANGAIKAFDHLGNEIEEVRSKAGSADKGFASLKAHLSDVGKTAGIAAASIAAFSTAAAVGIANIMSKGSSLDDVASSFKKLAADAGVAGDVLLSKFGASLGNTITKTEQMRIANELLVAGLDPGKFELLGKAARSLAETTGGSAVEGIERLNDSLLRGNTRALKSVGIIIDETKAIEDFARAHGRAASEVSDLGRIAAIREASIAALAEAQERLGDVTDDAGDKIDQFKSKLGDAKDQLYLSAANSKSLNEMLDRLNEIVSESNIDWFVGEVAALADAASRAWHELKEVAASMVEIDPDNLSWLDPSNWGMKSAAAINDYFNPAPIQTFTNELQSQVEVWDDLSKSVTLNTQTLKKHGQASESGLFTTTQKTPKAVANVDRLNEELQQFDMQLRRMLGGGPLSQFEQSIKDAFADETIDTTEEFIARIEEIAREAYKAKIPLAEILKMYDAVRTGNVSGSVEYGPASDQGVSEGRSASDSQKWADENPTASWLSSNFGFSEAISEQMVDVGNQIGSILSSAIVQSVNEGMTGADWKGVVTSIGAQIGSHFGIIGQIVGPLLFSSIFDMFGGEDSEGTKARKQADKYFAEIFDAKRLKIIVNGELTELKDMVFNGNTLFGGAVDLKTGAPAQYLESMSATAQAAFKGVGAAFEEIIGTAEDFDGMLAQVLANNAGNLNNLQLMIEATGKSFEELGEAALEAFYKGKLSALELQQALEQMQGVMQNGIPDAVGAVDQAFQNMLDAGYSGGRVLLDAITDVGAEALELGLSTLPQLADMLVTKYGFAAQEVQLFIAALEAAGIKSIKDLAEAGVETVTAAAANMEAGSQGQAMTHTPVNLTSSTPTTTHAASSGSSSKSSAASKAESALKQLRQATINALESSDLYASIVEKLTNGQISQSQATKQLRAEYDQIYEWQQKLSKAEEARNKALRTGKGDVAEYTARIEKLKEKLDGLTDTSSEGTFNAEFLDFIGKFADNLDLIALAADKAGISLDAMKESAMGGFLSGTESISEAWAKMQDVGPGISGKTGAVAESYKKMLEAGSMGGTVTMNYLRGMAGEVKEFGGTTLDDLSSMLLGQGVSSSEVSLIMSGLQNAGIDSLDELEGASNETALNILHYFEELQVPFQETSESIKNITKELQDIPNSKDVTINIKKGAIDPALAAILDSFGLLPEGWEDGYNATTVGLSSKKNSKKSTKKGNKKKGK